MYKRWGVGKPVKRDPWLGQFSVNQMYLGSYAKPGYEGRFVSNGNIDQQPRVTVDQCSGWFQAELSIAGWATVAFPIPDCTTYTPSWGSTTGKYSLHMDQGVIRGDGDRDMEYAQAVKVVRGQSPLWSDRQWAEFSLGGKYTTCDSTNSNKVCPDPEW